MNMKMKTLAAAVLMAAGGQAMAATAQLTSGNSELIFNVYDTVALTSFSMDLAPLASASVMGSFYLNDFLPTGVTPGGAASTGNPVTGSVYTVAPGGVEASNINWDWTIGTAAWTTFQNNVAAAGSNSGNWRWNVYAGDTTGAAGQLDQVRMITTSLATEAQMDVGINMSNASLSNPLFAGINSSGFDDDQTLAAVTGDSLYYPAIGGDTLRDTVTQNVMANVGESMSFFYVSGICTVSRGCSAYDAKQFGNGAAWTFDGTSLNYSTNAVPVPAAVWLLGSALVGLVGVSRRREIA